jgi:5-methylthioadenosine/S-adenosylhomocysteine deaminase
VIQGSGVVAIEPAQLVFEKWEAAQIIDATDCLIMPGFINAHSHVAMTMYRGFADDIPLKEWLENYIWPAEASFATRPNIESATQLALAEMMMAGTVMFADMYFHEDLIAQTSEKAGMRMLAGEGIFDFPTPNCKTAKDGLAYTEDLIRHYANNPLINISLAPHAIYTCSPENLKLIKALSEKYHVPVQIHLSETQVEVNDSLQRFGKRPVKHLQDLGMFNHSLIAAHMVHLTDEELELAAASGVRIAHNPQSNLKLASGFARVHEMLRKGVAVGLATDGTASNNNLEMLREMRTTSMVQKALYSDPTVCNAKQMLEMATLGSARVLGMDHRIGSIEIGKDADILIANLDQIHLLPLYNIYSHIVYSMQSSDIQTLFINGKMVMHNRNLLTLDIQAIKDRIKPVSDAIKEQFFHFNHNQNFH